MWKIYKNTGFMIWSGGMSMINSLLVWAIVARHLGQTAFGHFTLIMAIYLVFFNLCSLGLGPFIVREVAGERADKARFIAGTALILALAGVLCSGIMIATGLMLGLEPAALRPLMILTPSLWATALIAGCESLLVARAQASMIAAVNTGESLLKAVIPWSLMSLGFGLPAVCATFVVLRFGALAAYLIGMRHQINLQLPTRAGLRRILAQVPWFVLISLAAGLHWQIGAILLSKMRGAIDVAVYGAAGRLLVPWTLVCVSYATSVNPDVCRVAAQSPHRLGHFSARVMSNLLALVLPLAAGTSLVAPQLLPLLFGPGYEGAVAPLRLLIWSLAPLGVVLLLAKSLVATNNQRVDLWANLIGLGINVALSLWLIPAHGVLGVAVAQLISTLILCAVEWMYVSRVLYRLSLTNLMGRFAVATIAMAGLVSLVGATGLWVMIPVGILSYVGCLLVLGWRPVLKEAGGFEI
jgi:PST family polysaccharide transporter